jgi:hypothetical protein
MKTAKRTKPAVFPLADMDSMTRDAIALAKHLESIPDSHELTMQQSDAIDDLRMALGEALRVADTFINRYTGH